MFRVRFRRHYPGDLRQLIVQNVGAEGIKQRSALQDVGSRSRFQREWTAFCRVLILKEVQQRIVTVVANESIIRKSPEISSIQARASVLINFPRNSRLLQPLWISRPVIPNLSIVDHQTVRRLVVSIVADPTG